MNSRSIGVFLGTRSHQLVKILKSPSLFSHELKKPFSKTFQSKSKLSDSDQCKVQSVSSGDKTTSFRVTLAVKSRHLVSHC